MQNAYSCIAGYSCFNDGSIRQFQRRTAQWDMGKNFDMTGGFGPWMVSADELPQGAIGLKIETRLNGNVLQSDNTANMIFPVAETLVDLSQAMTLMPGDVIVTGTPSGVGHARKPPLWMKHGDVCEIEIEGVGILSNPIEDEKKNLMRRPAFALAAILMRGRRSRAWPRRRARDSSASALPGEIKIGVGHGIGFLPLYLARISSCSTNMPRPPVCRRASWSSATIRRHRCSQAMSKGESPPAPSASLPFCWRAKRQSRWSPSPESPPCRWCCSPPSRTSSRCPT